jgi:hypothetical protein
LRGRPREGQPRVRSRSRSRLLLASPASCSSQRAAGGYCNLADLGRDGQLGAALASLSALASPAPGYHAGQSATPRRSFPQFEGLLACRRRRDPLAQSLSARPSAASPRSQPGRVTSKDGAPSPPRGPGGGAGLGRPGGPPGGVAPSAPAASVGAGVERGAGTLPQPPAGARLGR